MINQATLSEQGENDLLEYLLGDNQQHFSKLYDRFSPVLFGLITRWIKDTEVAENLLQDVFVKAWKSRELYDASKGRLFTWLYNITRNICIDHLRSKSYKKTRVSLLSDDVSMFPDMPYSSFLPDTIGLRKLIDNLRKEEKEIIELMYYGGYTQREIAEEMNIPIGTVKTRISRAIRDLRYFFKRDWKEGTRALSLN